MRSIRSPLASGGALRAPTPPARAARRLWPSARARSATSVGALGYGRGGRERRQESVWKLSAHHHGLGAITPVELDNGDAYAIDKVANAAGPAAPSVAALVARNLPMRNRAGLAVRVETSRSGSGG